MPYVSLIHNSGLPVEWNLSGKGFLSVCAIIPLERVPGVGQSAEWGPCVLEDGNHGLARKKSSRAGSPGLLSAQGPLLTNPEAYGSWPQELRVQCFRRLRPVSFNH